MVKPKIKILDVKTEGSRLSLHVEFDTGEQFWYVTSSRRSITEIKEILRRKYEQMQRMKTEKRKTQELIQSLKDLEISW